jgi:hypothetical protein
MRAVCCGLGEARYLLGDLLIYQPDDGQDLQTMVAIDGRLAPIHQDALNLLEGLRFIGISPLAGKVEADDTSHLPPELIAERVPIAEVRKAQTRIANATRRMDQATGRRADFQDADELPSPEDAKAELEAAQQQLSSIVVREVETYEMRSLLERAMRESRRRLLIVSPWITGSSSPGRFRATKTLSTTSPVGRPPRSRPPRPTAVTPGILWNWAAARSFTASKRPSGMT